ncbi:MAG: hypothetical protein JNL38_18145 [Myxococcales bacterium]|jgi:hypothetical protein|nr:hypothetical protein [Myxococcales bacterium]
MIRRGAAAVLVLAALGAPAVARAAPADEQLAQSLFDAGRLLMDKGDYARACPMLAESQRLDPGGGTLLNLAVCHEREGKLGLAWTELNQALSQALKDGRKDREATAREHMAAIEPKLPRLLLRYGKGGAAPPEGLVIELDGTTTSAAMLGVATPLDAGRHAVKVTAPGFEPFVWQGDVTPEKTTDVTIAELKPVAPKADPPRGPAPLPPRNAERSTTTAVILGASAGALLVGAGVTYALSLSAASDANDACIRDRSFCANDDGVSAVSRARAFTWVSLGMAGAGAATGVAALAMGLVSVVTHVKGATLTVTPSASGATVGAGAAF